MNITSIIAHCVLNAIEKCILMEINSLDNEEHCSTSNKYLAELMGFSQWKLSTRIKKLGTIGSN